MAGVDQNLSFSIKKKFKCYFSTKSTPACDAFLIALEENKIPESIILVGPLEKHTCPKIGHLF